MGGRDFLGVTRRDEATWGFRVGPHLCAPGGFLFGGAALAIGVAALEESTNRPCLWASAHFLRHAPRDSEPVLTAERLVDGTSVTHARATLHLDGHEVCVVEGTFGVPRGTLDEPRPWRSAPPVPPALACEPYVLNPRYDDTIYQHLPSRTVFGRHFDELDGTPGPPHWSLWIRPPSAPDVDATTLALLGDVLSGAAAQALGRPTMGRSFDNTIRVVTSTRTEWVLVDMRLDALAHGVAQGHADLWSESGVLLATASQTLSIRPLTKTATGEVR